eukprot:scaffold6531_cov169-Ochromonas_danica.AAC.12
MLTGVDSVDDPWELIKDPLSLERLDLARSNPSDRERCLKRVKKAIFRSAKSGSLCLSARKLQRFQHNERIRLTFNRIVRNDLRRVFPSMYYNVLNLADSKLTEEFLCHYFSPDCEVLSYFLSQLEHCEREGAGAGAGSTVATCIQCRGPLELAHQIARSATPFSDYVFLSMKSRIIRRLEASHFSIIEVDSDFKATALLSQPSSSAALRLEERSCSYNSLHSTTANCSSRPVTVDAKVKFFLHMNSEGFIVKSVSYLI